MRKGMRRQDAIIQSWPFYRGFGEISRVGDSIMTKIRVFGEKAKELATQFGLTFDDHPFGLANQVIIRLDSVEGRDIVEVEL